MIANCDQFCGIELPRNSSQARKLVFNGKIQCACIYGGQSVKDQLKQLANGVDIVRLVLFISRSFSRA